MMPDNNGFNRHLIEHLHRRGFLRGAALTTLPFLTGVPLGFAFDGAKDGKSPGLIPRDTNPDNLETPFAALKDVLTPNEQFYVRSHFAVPKMDAKTYRLNVGGAVEKAVELTLDQLQELPAKTLTMTLECAGNGRAFLNPKTKGVQWELGAVSTAEWTGVPLSAVLEKAGLRKNAVDVVLEGGDTGESKNDAKPAGALHFTRGLPLAKALKPEVLLAFKMNGEPLSANHGLPLRAVVGGWYGVASIKWLSRVLVTDRPFVGFEQSIDYSTWERRDGIPSLVPIAEMEVKASIARPSAGETVPAKDNYRIFGAAWTGESEISKVEISTDAGQTWDEAKLLGKAIPFAWRLWEFPWKSPKAGKYSLMARATDKRGRTQPMQRDPDRRNYVVNHVVPVDVEVRDS
jgi:DMSO/TMAO reductase YedYZ molybdopterin-dependent catalytic subunit